MNRILIFLSSLSLVTLCPIAYAAERFFIGMEYQLDQPSGRCTTQHERAELILDLQTEVGRVDGGALSLSTDGENPLALACEGSVGGIISGSLGGAPPGDVCSFQSSALPDDFARSIRATRERDGHLWPNRLSLNNAFGAQFLFHYSWRPSKIAIWPSCPLRSQPISISASPRLVDFGPIDRFGSTWIRESQPVTLHGQLEDGGEFTAEGKLWLRRVDED